MNKLIFLVLLSLGFAGCTSSSLSKTGIEKIEFGSGGGFAGRYQTYSIDCKENVLSNSEGTKVRKLEKQEVKELRTLLKNSDFSSIDFNHPHNISYYLQFQGKNNSKITWGDPMFPVSGDVKKLYDTLMNFAKK